jgi:gliding motility-associated-like protein
MKLRWVFIVVCLLASISSFAQSKNSTSPVSSCGTDGWYENARKDVAFVKKEQQLNELIRNKILQKQSAASESGTTKRLGIKPKAAGSPFPNVYEVPVVFHILSENPEAITDAMIIAALNDLNDAFAHRGAYSSDPLGVSTDIEFCLAKIAPDGGNTTGINRVKSYFEGVDKDLEVGRLAELSDWNHQEYINIWVVGNIRAENPATYFDCGKWTRIGVGGFAGPGFGLVVAGLSGPLLAHEMGHYLTLYHTFEGQNCLNNDCTLNGDLVCDTPPDRSINSSPCNSPENSCRTDTLSGFTKDQPDNISNFMDYGSPCPSVFTFGQAERMRTYLEVYSGGSLLASNKCDPPCAGVPQAAFEYRSTPYPKAGELVNFNNLTPGNDPFEWLINGLLAGTTKDFSYTFPVAGVYELSLRVYNSVKTCYSTFISKVNVNCGVEARFSPDKRKVTHSGSIYSEPVTFTNFTYGGTSFQWYLTDNTGNNFQPISTDRDWVYSFPSPGLYRIKLVATDGTCTDESPIYTVNVLDARMDGAVYIYAVNCYKNDSIRVEFAVANNGYDSIPAGTPIKFYDKIPGLPGGSQLAPDFLLPNDIYGKCGNVYTHIVKASKTKQDTIMAIFDEANLFNELDESNNTAFRIRFQPKLTIQPADTIVNMNTNLPVVVKNQANDPLSSVIWSPASQVSCANCLNPTVVVNDTMRLGLTIQTIYGCVDTISAYIKVFPIDIEMKKSVVNCYATDTIIVSSDIYLLKGYTSLKKPVQIQYFDNDSTGGVGKLIGVGWIPVTTPFPSGFATIQHVIPQTRTGKVVSYINVAQTVYEPDVSNNATATPFTPFAIDMLSNQINLLRNEKLQLFVINQGDTYKSIRWSPSGGLSCDTCWNPVLYTLSNRNYTITGTNKFFCVDTATLLVNVYYQSHIALPNTFSPNGDGVNDYFYVISGERVTRVNQFQIFSRWGEKVFETSNVLPNDFSGGWNGMFKGKQAPAGTYVYVLLLGLTDGTTETYRGNITLMR